MKFSLQRLPHLPARIRKRLRNHGLRGTLAWLQYQLAWRVRERRLGIDTREHAFNLDVYGSGGGQGYDPIDHRLLEIILDYLDPDPQRDVFLDYGSGLGRPIIFAAMRPFHRVLGVEINQQLVELGRRQVDIARSRAALVCGVEIVHADAADYTVPPDVNRVLMYNAFVGDLLHRVLEQLRQSLVTNPRELWLVYVPLVADGNQLEACPWLRLRDELPTAYWDHVRACVYEARLDALQTAAQPDSDSSAPPTNTQPANAAKARRPS